MSGRKWWSILALVMTAAPALAQIQVKIGDADLPARRSQLGGIYFESGESVRIVSDDVIDGDLLAFAPNSFNLNGTVRGDLSVVSMLVFVSGPIGGDLDVVASELNVDGTIGDGARILSQNLHLSGEVGGNVMVWGKTLTFEPSSRVGGTLLAKGGRVNLAGSFEGPVQIGPAGVVVISGRFLGDLHINCDTLRFEPGASIEGNLVYSSRNDVGVPEGVVSGVVKREEKAPEVEECAQEDEGFSLAVRIFIGIYLALVSLVAGGLMILFFRPFVEGALFCSLGGAKLVMSFGTGLVALLVMLFFGVLCIFLIPFSLGLWAALGTLIYFGGLVGKAILGHALLCPLFRRGPHPLLALLAGIALVMLIGFIPYLGTAFWAIVTITGVGACLLQIRAGGRSEDAGCQAEPVAPLLNDQS